MQLSQSIKLRQKQSLVMTPQLQGDQAVADDQS